MSAKPNNIRHPEKLAMLVGSNPLPNYLAALVLQPREVVLLYSPETIDPRDRLRTALETNGVSVSERCIDDATDARKIRDACQQLKVDHLHYSGGTKPMAALAYKSFQLVEEHASYLDERKGRLRFDDGYDVKLSDCDLGLTLDVVLALHGAERNGPKGVVEGGPTESDVAAIRDRVLKEPDFSADLYGHFRPNGKPRNLKDANAVSWKPADHGLALSTTRIPDTDWVKKRYEAWDDCVTGGWLERSVASLIRSYVGTSVPVEIGVFCKRRQPVPRQFEIDIAVVRGHRLYVVSCTTDSRVDLCKSKLFEVAMRARQMGGDLARSALVCLIDGGNKQGLFVEQLRADITSVWGAPNTPAVFGLADLREWFGFSVAANFVSLKDWLDK